MPFFRGSVCAIASTSKSCARPPPVLVYQELSKRSRVLQIHHATKAENAHSRNVNRRVMSKIRFPNALTQSSVMSRRKLEQPPILPLARYRSGHQRKMPMPTAPVMTRRRLPSRCVLPIFPVSQTTSSGKLSSSLYYKNDHPGSASSVILSAQALANGRMNHLGAIQRDRARDGSR